MATQARPRRQQLNLKSGFSLLKEAAKEFSEDKVPRLGAALAYYTIFSLAPLLIIVIAIVGLVLGQQQTVQSAVISQMRGLVGPASAAPPRWY